MPTDRAQDGLTLLAFEVLWRCDGCGFEQITPQDDPPANCPRCQHPSVFWVRGPECKRLRDPATAGPTCGCPDSACALEPGVSGAE